jgi:hypothetical protein
VTTDEPNNTSEWYTLPASLAVAMADWDPPAPAVFGRPRVDGEWTTTLGSSTDAPELPVPDDPDEIAAWDPPPPKLFPRDEDDPAASLE